MKTLHIFSCHKFSNADSKDNSAGISLPTMPFHGFNNLLSNPRERESERDRERVIESEMILNQYSPKNIFRTTQSQAVDASGGADLSKKKRPET